MAIGDLYEALTRGELDLAYASGLREQRELYPAGPRTLTTVPFRRYWWVFVATADVTRDMRGDHRTIYLPEYAHRSVPRIESALRAYGEFSLVLAQDTEASKSAALANMGVACVPAYTVRSELAAGNLRYCFDRDAVLDNMIYVGHERRPRHPDVALVVAATRRLPNFDTSVPL